MISDREYQCLGQWEEAGLLYTYTKRRDIEDSFECFIGAADQKNNIYLIEGGINCRRGLDVISFGMKLNKKNSCPVNSGLAGKNYKSKISKNNKNKSPWLMPTVKQPGNNISNSPRRSIPPNVIRQQDIEDLATRPWQPQTGNLLIK